MKNKFLIGGGLLLLAAALCLTLYNLWDERRAGESAEELLLQYREQWIAAPVSRQEEPDDSEIPTVEIGDNLYIGVIEIPSQDVSLPVMEEWSYAALKDAPCRYKGSASGGDLIIAGHNYRFHFGNLHKLEAGDEVIFTDAPGNRFEYRVSEVTHIDGDDTEGMEAGEWDLTLFTCTTDSQSRVTVRCVSAD